MMKRVHSLLPLASVLLATLALCQAVPEEKLVSTYRNCDYGYAVDVPRGLSGIVREHDNHGFRVLIPGSDVLIWVYNAYNMTESTSVRDIAERVLTTRAEGIEGWHLGPMGRISVAGLEAVRVFAADKRDGREWKSEHVVVYRPAEDGEARQGAIVYSFSMSAPRREFHLYRRQFDEVVAGFRLLAPPRGPCDG